MALSGALSQGTGQKDTGGTRMGTFNVSLKTLTKRVSMEVVYTPRELDQINVEIA